MAGTKILFSTRAYSGCGHRIAGVAECAVGRVHAEIWRDGELYQRIETPVKGEDVVLVGGTDTDARAMEAFDLAYALIEQGARSLTLIIPFFGYSTMERAWMPGEAVTAKSRARLWSALPSPPWGTRIRILEPHTPDLPHYFGAGCRVAGIDSVPLLLEMLEASGEERPVLCSPDVGRIKWVDAIAKRTGRDSAFVLKRRGDQGRIETLGISGDVRKRHVVLCDDMIRTGGTLIHAAGACLEAGAASVSAAVIHGAFVPGALPELEACGFLRALRCTDSHPRSGADLPDWVDVAPCERILAAAIDE